MITRKFQIYDCSIGSVIFDSDVTQHNDAVMSAVVGINICQIASDTDPVSR